ncbi:MAG: Holliday junction resolvase RuvX, partial [Anaerolineales bacterium]|nr:Holliday junction resolvase RuvX [Anaerolineales bacterium]
NLWDEYGSTKKAQDSRQQMNVSRKNRSGHLDQVAAAVILQTYLDHLIDQEAD